MPTQRRLGQFPHTPWRGHEHAPFCGEAPGGSSPVAPMGAQMQDRIRKSLITRYNLGIPYGRHSLGLLDAVPDRDAPKTLVDSWDPQEETSCTTNASPANREVSWRRPRVRCCAGAASAPSCAGC